MFAMGPAFFKQASPATSYAATILADTPVAFWELNESSGTTAADYSGNAYNGTYTGTYTLGQPSIMPHGSGASLELTGNGYVALPSVAALNALNHPLSLEFWIKTSTPASTMSILNLGSNGSASQTLSNVSSQQLTFGYVNVVNNATSTTVLAANTTYHCVVTVDSGGNITFYVNGTTAGTGTTSGNVGSGAGTIGIYAHTLANFPYTGYIQNVAVYDYALTSTQVADHYAAG